jgi:hypothetical protein
MARSKVTEEDTFSWHSKTFGDEIGMRTRAIAIEIASPIAMRNALSKVEGIAVKIRTGAMV